MISLVRIAQLIGLNAVPGFGYFARDWSAGTVLAVYWFENLLGSLLVAARIDIHRRLTNKRGHYMHRKAIAVTMTTESGTRKLDTILSSFLVSALVFTLAQGFFLVFILGKLPDSAAIAPGALRTPLEVVTALLVAGFAVDLIGIRDRPFFWIHRITDRMLSRVFVVFVVIFVGIPAIAYFRAPRGIVALFMVLKTCADIAAELPESETGSAPQWQLAIARLFGAEARFAAFAQKANREYGKYQPEDELLGPPAVASEA